MQLLPHLKCHIKRKNCKYSSCKWFKNKFACGYPTTPITYQQLKSDQWLKPVDKEGISFFLKIVRGLPKRLFEGAPGGYRKITQLLDANFSSIIFITMADIGMRGREQLQLPQYFSVWRVFWRFSCYIMYKITFEGIKSRKLKGPPPSPFP